MSSPASSASRPAGRVYNGAPRPPSSAQRDLLAFFGRTATTAREAFEAIKAEMENPAQELRWREERARRCLATKRGAVDGEGGCHDYTLHIACLLVQGFDLPLSSARAILAEWNMKCSPPWADHELDHKIRSADKQPGLMTREGLKSRGCLAGGKIVGQFRPNAATRAAAGGMTETAARQKVEFEPETLRRLAAPWADKVNLVWLANRSAVDPAEVSAERFLQMLYRPGEKVWVALNDMGDGQVIWPDSRVPLAGPQGVKFLAQPVTGNSAPNPRGKPRPDGSMPPSKRIAECVTNFRYMLLESDEAPTRDWLGFIVQMPLRIEALYTSGGRSVHALVRVDCATKEAWDTEKAAMLPFLMGAHICGADRRTWSAVRLTRLPGCWRAEKNAAQKLLYIQPEAPLRRLCELPAKRDVEASWLAQAALVKGDDDPEWLRWLTRGLDYYARVSKACAAARAEVQAKIDAIDGAAPAAGEEAAR